MIANDIQQKCHLYDYNYAWTASQKATDLAVLTIQLITYTHWLLCTTADDQLTSRSRLEPLHIVSQGMGPISSGNIISSMFPLVFDICMVGWTGAEHELTVCMWFSVC